MVEKSAVTFFGGGSLLPRKSGKSDKKNTAPLIMILMLVRGFEDWALFVFHEDEISPMVFGIAGNGGPRWHLRGIPFSLNFAMFGFVKMIPDKGTYEGAEG